MDLESQLDQIKEYLDFYTDLTGKEVPATISAAVNQEWLVFAKDVGSDIVDELLEHYPKDEREKDKMRVVTASKAQKVLLDYEEALIAKLVTDPLGIFTGTWMKMLKRREFFFENEGKLTIAIIEAVNEFKAELLSELEHALISILTEGPIGAIEQLLSESAAIIAIAIASGYIAVGLEVGREVVETLSSDTFKQGVKPVLTERKKAIDAARRAVLPQRSGPRVRRRKVSRK